MTLYSEKPQVLSVTVHNRLSLDMCTPAVLMYLEQSQKEQQEIFPAEDVLKSTVTTKFILSFTYK